MAAKKTRKLVKTPKKKALGRSKPARSASPARKKDVAKLKKKLRVPTAKKAAARVVTKKKVRPEKAKAAVAKTKKVVARPEKKQVKGGVTKKLKKKLIQKAERPVEKNELRKSKKKRLEEKLKLKKQARIEREEGREARSEKAERILRKKLAKERKLAARNAEEAPVKKRVEATGEEQPKKKKKKKKLLGEKPPVESKPSKKVEAEEAPVKTKLKLKKKKKKIVEAAQAAEPTAEVVKKKTKIAEKTPEKAPEKTVEKVKTKTKDAPAEKPEKVVKKAPEGKEKAEAPVSEKVKVRDGEKVKVRDGEKVKVRDGEKAPKVDVKKKGDDKPSDKGAPAKAKSTDGEKKAAKSDKPSGEAKPKKEEKSKSEPRITAVREPAPRVAPIPLPLLAPARKPTIEERSEIIEKRLESQTEEFRRAYTDRFDMSWIFHDSALEGVVYTFEELRSGLGSYASHYGDTGMQPTYDDIRKHKEAIEFVRDYAKKKLPVTIDVIRKIYLILHPEEGDIKTVKYRKDIPQHRLYFHEYAPPDKIPYKVRQIVDWLNDPETRKTRNALRIAARAHYDLLRVYPFQTDSGKVARLFMNLLLMRSGLPPSIIHSTERQRYYEALKGQATTVLQMVQEAVENALSSVEKLLDEYETRKRAFVS